MAKNAIKGWGQEETPAVLLLAMITIISQQVNATEAQNLVHWASVPHPPLLHVVTWKSPSVSVFTNDSELVVGHSSGHLVPTFTNYNFTGQAVALPICLGNLPYCLPFMPIWKSVALWNGIQFLDKKLELFGFNATEPYNAIHWPHIPCCLDKRNPWRPIREPHGNNVCLLLQWLLMLQDISLCIGLIMAILKLI
jgi:hypothetical protein